MDVNRKTLNDINLHSWPTGLPQSVKGCEEFAAASSFEHEWTEINLSKEIPYYTIF